jgi:hypothetical protein
MDRVLAPDRVKLRSEFATVAEGQHRITESRAFIAALTAQLNDISIAPDGSLPGTEAYRVCRLKIIGLRYHEEIELNHLYKRTQELERAEKKPTQEADHIISDARKSSFAVYDYVKYLNDENCKLVIERDKLEKLVSELKDRLADVQNQLDTEKRRRR